MYTRYEAAEYLYNNTKVSGRLVCGAIDILRHMREPWPRLYLHAALFISYKMHGQDWGIRASDYHHLVHEDVPLVSELMKAEVQLLKCMQWKVPKLTLVDEIECLLEKLPCPGMRAEDVSKYACRAAGKLHGAAPKERAVIAVVWGCHDRQNYAAARDWVRSCGAKYALRREYLLKHLRLG